MAEFTQRERDAWRMDQLTQRQFGPSSRRPGTRSPWALPSLLVTLFVPFGWPLGVALGLRAFRDVRRGMGGRVMAGIAVGLGSILTVLICGQILVSLFT